MCLMMLTERAVTTFQRRVHLPYGCDGTGRTISSSVILGIRIWKGNKLLEALLSPTSRGTNPPVQAVPPKRNDPTVTKGPGQPCKQHRQECQARMPVPRLRYQRSYYYPGLLQRR